MSLSTARHRSSTSASIPAANSKARQILSGLLDNLLETIGERSTDGYPDATAIIQCLTPIVRHIGAVAPPSSVQDDFRQLHGFNALIGVLRAYSGYYDPIKRTEKDTVLLFDLLDITLRCLDLSLRDHAGSRRYFKYRVEDGEDSAQDSEGSSQDKAATAKSSQDLASVPSQVREILGPTTMLHNPEVLRVLVSFWLWMPRPPGQAPHPCSLIFLETLSATVSASIFNLSAVHSTQVPSQLLRATFGKTPGLSTSERHVLLKLYKMFMYFGVNQLEDAQFLLSSDSPETSDFSSFASTNIRLSPVQAFIGTPRDLSTQLGSGFQTYEASAALGLRNELFHPGKDDTSDIIKAIREKASSLLSESKILLSILPTGALYDDCLSKESQLFRALPRAAASSLVHLMRRHGSTIVVNAAAVSLTDALLGPQGVAILSGQPVIAVPSYLDDNLWQLSGFTPLALKLLQRASTPEEAVRSVEIILQCIQNNWRNSEAMERDGGYSVMGMLLRVKLGHSSPGGDNGVARLRMTDDERESLTFRLLSLVLGFVGYNHEHPIESFIINPLAYRILLIDFDTWRKSAPLTQKLYYQQFVTFAVMSKYHEFNSRRLMRMRIIKRLLDAMKAETIAEAVLPSFLEAFEHLVKCNFNSEVHRALALFLTYSFHSPSTSLSRTPKPLSAISRASTPGLGIIRRSTPEVAEASAKGLTVTNKWLLYLLSEDDAEIVVHGCKVLARLLVSHGPGYTSKFAAKTGGFIIMGDRLKRWWDIPTLWPICFSILFGYDVAEIDFDRNFNFFNLIEILESPRLHIRISCP
ncbi:unnamed protein product [Parascedosporium putredinis]|uniref:Alfy-like armadillo-like repeat domain-containing protein n=1 Tax=Parascedosporium putredinis TaxID=1442378 RepID=A0A9P1GW61_9PEZI|nr:unnamed protein product [Parascedosporium putredinis]CAI7988141.1 unnamed protein product [Parascedosporium putredinis]